jgi:hypothetical protein
LTAYKNARIKLFKLHGSIDWKFNSNKELYVLDEQNLTKLEDNAILYPGFKGVPQIEPFKTLHKQFEISLKSGSHLIVIGFAFRDEHINSIIKEALNENKDIKVTIWNPDKQNTSFINNEVFDLLEYFQENSIAKFDIMTSFNYLKNHKAELKNAHLKQEKRK